MSVSGPVPGRPYTRTGGLAIRGDGVSLGVRPNLNFVSSPGAQPMISLGTDRVNISWQLNTEVLLGEALIDLLAPGPVTLLSSPTFTRAHVTRVIVVVTSLTGGITTQPIIEVGTDTPGTNPNDDIAMPQFLDNGLNAVDFSQDLILENPRATIDQVSPTDIVRFRVDSAAVGPSTYIVSAQLYGVVVTP